MVRKLKFHEQKLLKKVDFLSWKIDNNLAELRVMRKYYIQRREDYTKYNQLSRQVRDLARKIRELEPSDPFRLSATERLVTKLYNMGVIGSERSLQKADEVSATSFCRRRLPVVMVRRCVVLLVQSGMAENLKTAVTFVEQGHVRVGPDVVTDPAYLVTRMMSDLVTWTNASKIKKHILQYNEERDDFDLD